jgi:hypothetical protein
MCLVPVPAAAGLETSGTESSQRAGAFHHRFDDPRRVVGLGFGDLEEQLLMDLQQPCGP